MTLHETITANVAALLKHLGISRGGASARAGYRPGYLQDAMRGDDYYRSDTIDTIADIFDLLPSQLCDPELDPAICSPSWLEKKSA